MDTQDQTQEAKEATIQVADLPMGEIKEVKKPREWGWWENEDGNSSEKLAKLEEGFLMGMTDKEACLYADISLTQLYYYQGKNPDFTTKKEHLKDNPKMLARVNIYREIRNGKVETSTWYLERKAKDEFSPRVEQTGKDGEKLIPVPILGTYVSTDPSNQKAVENDQTDTRSTGRDISFQNNLNTPVTDRPSPEGQASDPDLDNVGIVSSLETGSDEGLQEHNAGTQVLEGQ